MPLTESVVLEEKEAQRGFAVLASEDIHFMFDVIFHLFVRVHLQKKITNKLHLYIEIYLLI